MFNSDNQLLDDIHEVNLSYLILAQRLLKKNKSVGMYRLGINEDVAETLMELSPAQIVRLASSSSLLCNFRLNDYDLLKTLSKDVLGGVLQKAHSTILLAQRATATLTADSSEA